jgi:hypothetical protein
MPRRQLLPEPQPESTELDRSVLDNEFLNHVRKAGNDPRRKLFELALRAEDNDDLATAARCWAELAQYVSPKLRSMEVNAKVQVATVGFHIDLGGGEGEPQNEP